jgi:hypothetical protein
MQAAALKKAAMDYGQPDEPRHEEKRTSRANGRREDSHGAGSTLGNAPGNAPEMHHVRLKLAENPCFTRGFLWRYRWDLNPRWAFTHTTFRELHLRPLGHGTADYIT